MLKTGTSTPCLLFVQPRLFEYREHLLYGLERYFKVIGLFVVKTPHVRSLYCEPTPVNPLSWLYHAIRILSLFRGPASVFLPAYSNHLGILLVALYSKFVCKRLYIHGQALFKKPDPAPFDVIISVFWLVLANKYIAYSCHGLHGPFNWRIFRSKVVPVNNRFESLDSLFLGRCNYSKYSDLTAFIDEHDSKPFSLLYIGRNRGRSGLDLLAAALSSLSSRGYNIVCHLVGIDSSPSPARMIAHGSLYGRDILAISAQTSVGIYPGDAGLSVLHYMALGLCPLVHSDLFKHMGPEPCHVVDNENGILFKRGSLEDLSCKIALLFDDRPFLNRLRVKSRQSAERIHSLPYSEEISRIILS